MNRRKFLELMASAGLGLGLSQLPLKRIVQRNPIEPAFTAYAETFKTAACGLCPAGCSIRARLVNGHLVGVSGNPMDPFTGGGLCVKGLSILHQLYHPDRLVKPLKRTGPPGSDSWKVVEWDEAINAVAAELRKITAAAPQRIVFLNGRPFGFMNLLIRKWMRCLGSPNHIADHYLHAFPIATRCMMGKPFYPAYEMSKLDLLVSVGDPFLDYSTNPVFATRQYGEFPGRMIVFDDVKGITAEKADRFYRIEPGTHGAIILALANVITRFERYDKEFVSNQTTGLQEWNQQALQKYSPEIVETITGVSADTLYQVATELARADHKVVSAGAAAMSGRGGLHTAMAMLAVNALLGTIDRDLRMESPVEQLLEDASLREPPASDEQANRIDRDSFPLSQDAPWVIPDILQSRPDAVSALFLYYSNPLASHPGANRWQNAFQQIPLIVSFSPFLDESASYANWVLPDSLCLERHQEFVHPPVTGMNRITVSQPLFDKPLFDTRSTGDVLIQIIHRADPKSESQVPWKSYVRFMEACFEDLWRRNTGTVFIEPQRFQSSIELAIRGYRVDAISNPNDFQKALYESGGWIQPVYIQGQWGRLLNTTSNKFEFVSSMLRQQMEGYLTAHGKALKDLGLAEVPDIYHMSCYVPAVTKKGYVGKLAWLITRNTGSVAELPWWWEVVGMHRYLQWQMWAELGTEDPKAARLDAGERPSCEFRVNDQTLRLPVVLRYAGHPKVLVVPTGFRRTLKRSTPLPRGFNILASVHYFPDPLTGIPSYYFDIDSMQLSEERV